MTLIINKLITFHQQRIMPTYLLYGVFHNVFFCCSNQDARMLDNKIVDVNIRKEENLVGTIKNESVVKKKMCETCGKFIRSSNFRTHLKSHSKNSLKRKFCYM